MWPRITSRTDDRSKRTTPADAAVRHASAGAPKPGAPADSASSSAGDDTSRSTTAIGTRGQRYSPVRLMCSQPSGETWARNSAGLALPALRLAKTASPSFSVFQ